jgi:AhpD family alkylhydroperoxidase
MMSMYDMANMRKLKTLGAKDPDILTAYLAFGEAARAGGAIPKKYKELMAVAVALTTQCPYCIEIHKGEAVKAGATEVELAETAFRRRGPPRWRNDHPCNAPDVGMRSGRTWAAAMSDLSSRSDRNTVGRAGLRVAPVSWTVTARLRSPSHFVINLEGRVAAQAVGGSHEQRCSRDPACAGRGYEV